MYKYEYVLRMTHFLGTYRPDHASVFRTTTGTQAPVLSLCPIAQFFVDLIWQSVNFEMQCHRVVNSGLALASAPCIEHFGDVAVG